MKVGDKFVCICGCEGVYTIRDELTDKTWIVTKDEDGTTDYFDKDTEYAVPLSVYNSKLYKNLK